MNNHYRSHEIDFRIEKDYGVNLEFVSLDGERCVSVCDDNPRIVYLH